MFRRVLPILPSLLLALASAGSTAADLNKATVVAFDRPGLTADQLGVIVNDADPDSVAIAAYYVEKRGIPASNVIRVRFAPSQPNLPQHEFARIKRLVDEQTPSAVQAYALTWAQPYKVDCMSITSAFAFGFDPAYCASGCKPTKPSPYFNSEAALPYEALKIRPTMSLAAYSVAETKQLIDRGVASDGSNPAGSAYLVSTSDKARNVRAAGFEQTRASMAKTLPTEIIEANFIADKRDVMFYFTGLVDVPHVRDNRYLPGAMADHLTSAGGDLFGTGQMSILRWIEAGATGSYGAVVEPCNFSRKFPVPAIAMAHYLQGATLIEAYWKSVSMPGQGIFVGEPLARPFSGFSASYQDGRLRLEMRVIPPGMYAVKVAPAMIGPYREAGRIRIGWGTSEITLNGVQPGFFWIEQLTDDNPGS